MAAAMAGWRDAAEGRRRLEAIQSEGLAWFTPSSNPKRELRQGREEYIRLETEFHPADGSASIGADSLLKKIALMPQKVGKFSLRPIEGGLVVGEGMASVEAQAPTGFVHSFVVSCDDDYVTGAIEFSTGILEMCP